MLFSKEWIATWIFLKRAMQRKSEFVALRFIECPIPSCEGFCSARVAQSSKLFCADTEIEKSLRIDKKRTHVKSEIQIDSP